MVNYCLNCDKAIKTFPSLNQKFCSKKCYVDAHRIEIICQFCKKTFTVEKALPKTHPCKYCSVSCRAKHLGPPKPFKKGGHPGKEFGKGQLGHDKPHTKESKIKMSIALKGKYTGEKHWAWKGGTYDKDRKIDWGRKFYRDWRKAVLERDDYQCTRCGSEHYLEVDHIKPYILFPDLRYDVNNGRVLCHSCHTLTGTYGNRFMNLKEVTSSAS
jgi:hypothetical protein